MVKNTPLISLFLPSYVKILVQTPFSIRLFQHKKCKSVVSLFVSLLSVCRQNRVQIAPIATHFQWYKKGVLIRVIPPVSAHPLKHTKKPAESAIYSHSTGKIQPRQTPIKLLLQKTGSSPVKN